MNAAKRLIWQLYPSYAVIILVSLFAASWYTTQSLERFYLNKIKSDLLIRARLIEDRVATLLQQAAAPQIDAFCKKNGRKSDTRITVIQKGGLVLGDSEENPANMQNHADRPEIVEAIIGRVGTSVRYSTTLSQRMMYVAIPVYHDASVTAVIRTSVPLTAVDHEQAAIRSKIAAGALFTALVASLLCFWISRNISRPIEAMKEGAAHFAGGDLTFRLDPPATQELAGLAKAMNHMAAQLEDRIRLVINQRNEIEAILSSMMEGVIALDMEERILNLNQAARDILGAADDFRSYNIQDMIRNPEFIDIIRWTLENGRPKGGDIVWIKNGERILNVRCTPLRDARETPIGALAVISDVTRLRFLENMRRDFAANVSHELKTPLTAIKGFVETLRVNDIENATERDRFLAIIEKHVNRLTAIIDDLLQLSRIEREDELRQVQLCVCEIMGVLQNAVQLCRPKADARHIRITVDCETDISTRLDPVLMEQAFINLLDNAIKYSGEHSDVRVRVVRDQEGIGIIFQDFGIGIAQKHLPRLFERFYRVDPARSRTLGGTGLGLAIVKHIVKAHQGRVSVVSVQGKGSTFTITLPLAKD